MTKGIGGEVEGEGNKGHWTDMRQGKEVRDRVRWAWVYLRFLALCGILL